jgi:hypothetical protein
MVYYTWQSRIAACHAGSLWTDSGGFAAPSGETLAKGKSKEIYLNVD